MNSNRRLIIAACLLAGSFFWPGLPAAAPDRGAESPDAGQAPGLADDLKRFLRAHPPSPREQASQHSICLEIQEPGQSRPVRFVVPPDTIRKFVADLFQRQKYRELIVFTRQVVAKYPHPVYYSYLAETYYLQDRIDDAIAAYQKELDGLRGMPLLRYATEYMLYGIYHYDKQDQRRARLYLKAAGRSLHEIPQPEDARSMLAGMLAESGHTCLQSLQKYRKASVYFTLALALSPRNERLRFNLALCDYHQSILDADQAKFDRSVAVLKRFAETGRDREFVKAVEDILAKAADMRKEVFGK